ncbi:MAG: DUF5703 domain-containing protein [Kiritimatiellae bacterium]|nr:DUF5703 domain-containing protein [Kiritimatiellia bacterium]
MIQTRKKCCRTAAIVSLTLLTSVNLHLFATEAPALDSCNVIWDTPSRDMHGSMPIGNGDIGANLWMDENDNLVFYISKTDSWGDNGRLLKIGRVRVSLEPNPITGANTFHQELNLTNGEIIFNIKGANPTTIRLFVDANNPIIDLSINSAQPIKSAAKVELWRTEQKKIASQVASPFWNDPQKRELTVEPDIVVTNYAGGIAWYHRNIKSVGPDMSMKFQGLDDYPGYTDTLLHRTFGAAVMGKGAKKLDDLALEYSGTDHHYQVQVMTQHPATESEWLTAMERQIAATAGKSLKVRYAAHCQWWNNFWQRSWISISANAAAPEQKATTLIPPNDLKIKVGVDQGGGNQFVGEIGRLSLFKRALSAAEIAKLLANRDALERAADTELIYTAAPEISAELKDLSDWSTSPETTIEAWVKPEQLGGGGARIIDKISVGGSDGILLDTYPGNSLRLICGSRKINAGGDALPADKWSHVAVVISAENQTLELYLNGKSVAHEQVRTDLPPDLVVTRAYNLQRYIDACGARGSFPVKFNGSIFTVDYNNDPDDRRWGQGYWWQNTRLPYLSMTMSGDFEMMHSLFRMYADDIFPLCQFRTKKYFGYEGAYFAECMYPWGAVFSETYGWDKPYSEREDPLQRSKWHKWEWVCGPELVFMMMDYCEYSGDQDYLKAKVVPIADAVISFFESYYSTGDDGKLVMHPSQACETWIVCTNPMPELAGLHAITERLLMLDEKLATPQQRLGWQAFLRKLPPLPTRDTPDGRALAPAERFASKINVENPELYAVFPFRHVAVGNPNIEHGVNALKHRWDRGAFGWRQDDIFMAYLGLGDQAREFLVKRASTYDKNSRFPAFWGPNYDWVPDQDHGGVMMKAVQSMLLQADPYSRKLYLLPAWPKDWNVDFKLHAPYQTVIECSVKHGKVEKLKVTPSNRRKDIVINADF